MTLDALKRELRPMLALAGPVVLGEIGWISMGLVDTMMVGRIGAEALGAVSIGGTVFYGVAVFGMGVLLGLDTLVSQAFGAKKLSECHRALFHGFYLSLALTIPLTAILLGLFWSMDHWGIHGAVLAPTKGYFEALSWSLFPLLLYACFRRYLQGMGLVRPVMFALVSANLVNVAVNWILIFGHFGAPALGAVGAGWATCFSRVYMAGTLLAAILIHTKSAKTGLWETSFRFDFALGLRLWKLGFPAAMQMALEVGVFATAGALIGRLTPVALAAHQIALSVASFTFMVPLGVSSAAAVRVGQALGRRDPEGARVAGWTSLAIGTAFMSCAALAFFFAPRLILRTFTTQDDVILAGVTLLFLAALFQLFDGVQVVTTGILRGIGDTRTPMIMNFVGHWLLGLPVGYFLCFGAAWGVVGMWIGLSLGLIFCGIILLGVWARRARSLADVPILVT